MHIVEVSQENTLIISHSEKKLIKRGVSENMLLLNEKSCRIVL